MTGNRNPAVLLMGLNFKIGQDKKMSSCGNRKKGKNYKKKGISAYPDPVCAQAIRSRPAFPMGTEYFCTGVGLVYPQS